MAITWESKEEVRRRSSGLSKGNWKESAALADMNEALKWDRVIVAFPTPRPLRLSRMWREWNNKKNVLSKHLYCLQKGCGKRSNSRCFTYECIWKRFLGFSNVCWNLSNWRFFFYFFFYGTRKLVNKFLWLLLYWKTKILWLLQVFKINQT